MSKIYLIISFSLLICMGGMIWKYSEESRRQEPDVTQSIPRATRLPNGKAKAVNDSRKIKWNSLTDDAVPVRTRLNLARQIKAGLSSDEVVLLLAFLHREPTLHKEESWWVVMNEIMEQIRRKGVAPERLSKELISLVEDVNQSEVVRDYAVQHLSLWVAPASGNVPRETSSQRSAEALDAISATINDPSIAQTSIPGTAIMALTAASRNLSTETITPVWQSIDPAMTSMLLGEIDVPLSTRTTIIQSVAMRGSAEHLPLVQSMARDKEIDPSLRLSSIAALGIFGSIGDRAYLISIAQGQTRYRYAARSALKKLSN